jgi:hypothetical protein
MRLETWMPIVGLAVTLLLGLAVKPLLQLAQQKSELIPPSSRLRDEWSSVTKGDEGGGIVGHLERPLFFGCLWFHADLLIGAWLAFKVASKWNAWSNVTAVPDQIEGVDAFAYLASRRRWASNVLTTFLVGTLANILVGGAGVVVGRYGLEFARLILSR